MSGHALHSNEDTVDCDTDYFDDDDEEEGGCLVLIFVMRVGVRRATGRRRLFPHPY